MNLGAPFAALLAVLSALPVSFQGGGEPAPIAVPPADPLAVTGEEREKTLRLAADALAAAQTARGRFVQVSPDLSVTSGDFALRRPGRLRFDYDDPNPLLIVADGATVAIEDSALETVDRIPLRSTPLGLVLDDRIDFDTEADVTAVRRDAGLVAISMRDRTGEADGELTLIFNAETFELLSWETEDGAGRVTSVALEETETNVRLSPRLFRLEDPEDEDDRRRR